MSLDVRNLSKSFPVETGVFLGVKGTVRALRDFSVRVEKGESLGVVGESGSGKTTFGKILAGFLEPDSGAAAFGGVNLMSLKKIQRARLVQMVFQDPFSSLNPKLLLGTQLKESLKIHEPAHREDRAAQLMASTGLSADFLRRYPHQLSGGQRQRFAVARALSARPKLLIADEPVSSLDLSVQAQIINLLNDLRRSENFTLIVISHDLAVIAHLCDHVVVLKNGETVETGPAGSILERPQNAYTKRLLSAAPEIPF